MSTADRGRDGGSSAPRLVAGAAGLRRALDALERGEVVVVPTDTVYGLAARLDRPSALSTVFALKGRPAGLALPVLVHAVDQVGTVASGWPRSAVVLAAAYWPGPLTLVVPARPEVGPLLGGDGATVGVRAPGHRWVQGLCRSAGPLAVTSANRHGERPCTTAGAAARLFSEEVVVVDGGSCDGAPSTVVDCTSDPPRCLRRGGVPWEAVQAALR